MPDRIVKLYNIKVYRCLFRISPSPNFNVVFKVMASQCAVISTLILGGGGSIVLKARKIDAVV